MNRIAGIFDLARSGGSLGTLLILLEELEIQRRVQRAEAVEVVLVADAKDLAVGIQRGRAHAPGGAGLPRSVNVAALTTAVQAMSGITGCHACFDRSALDEVIGLVRGGCALWPDPVTLVAGGHSYDSTASIRKFHARTGSIPRLSVSAARLALARGYVSAKAGGRLAVALHLKNNPAVSGQSNADLASWHAFISGCRRDVPAHFFLIGDDATNADFRDLPNVTVARDDGIAIDGYLALIQAAGLFMGMMSGPANMALFGGNPYLVFKHPDHHAEEMALELGDSDHYSFALPDQRVLRTRDTTENLVSAFESVTQKVSA